MNKNNIKYLSLFSGIGGFELGIQQAYEELYNEPKNEGLQATRNLSNTNSDNVQRATCIGFSEIDKYAIQVYNKHFNHKNYGDITKTNAGDLPDFDLLVGGFPCQSFSIAGKRGGFNDTRGTLFFDIARIVREKQPRLLLLENVKGLLSHDKGCTFYIIISTLDELGYDCQWQVLNSKNFGVPQNRERVFIIGHLRGTSRPEVFPIRRVTKQTNKNMFIGIDNYRREGKLREYKGTCPTLNTNNGGQRTPCTIENTKIRRLTPKECERLQGFPDDWTKTGTDGDISDTQRYKMCGNAVTVNVIKEIMLKLL